MKTILITTLVSALSLTAFADPKEDVKAAAAKLAGAPCYTWTAKTDMGANSQYTPGVITGKADKGGYAVISQERDGNVTMAVMKGDKGVVKTESGWKTAEELRAAAQGGGGGGGMRAAGLLRTRLPSDDAGKLADKAQGLKLVEGAITGDLTEAGAKELLSFGRGGGQNQPPEAKNAKGTVKYWLKDGQIAKMEVKVAGTITTRNGEDRDMARTTTYEIKDIGTTKVEAPAEAKAKLGS